MNMDDWAVHPRVLSGGPRLPQIVAAAGKEFAERLICYAAADVPTKNYKDLEAKYATILKPPVIEFAVFFCDAARMRLNAMQADGTVEDTDKISAALEKQAPYKRVQGTTRWSGMKEYRSDDRIPTSASIGMIKDGKQDIIGRMDY